jgi:hypothetical protein
MLSCNLKIMNECNKVNRLQLTYIKFTQYMRALLFSKTLRLCR